MDLLVALILLSLTAIGLFTGARGIRRSSIQQLESYEIQWEAYETQLMESS